MNNFLVVIMNMGYNTDFLIIQAKSADDAKEIVSKLPKVLDVMSVWKEVEHE
jgi:hypothetical protein